MGWVVANLTWFAWALLAASIVGVCWALFWDRSRGRARCRRCRYRMEGIPVAANGSIVCPECGKQHARARQLLYTRRRWFVAAFSLSVVSISWYALAFHWRFRERGWMGYVPTTVLVVLPQSADAWYTAAGFSGSTAPHIDEVLYRVDTVGMRGWQEHLWVLNLRNRAEANSSQEGWKWRFVRAPDRSDRQWKRHRCRNWCKGFVSSYGRQYHCPGEGAWCIKSPGIIESVESGVWIVARIHENECSSYWDLGECSEVELSSKDWWPEISAYVAYNATDRGNELVREGLRYLWQPAGWRPETGLTGVADVPCTFEGEAGYIRQFDLGPTIDAVRAANPDIISNEGDQRLVGWVQFKVIGTHRGISSEIAGHPLEGFLYRRSLFVASTREGIDEVTRRLEEFHTKAPALWRELQDE